MSNLLIRTFENITAAVLNRFMKFDHYITGFHKTHKEAANFASFGAAVDDCGDAGSPPCTLALSKVMRVGSNKTLETHITLMPKNGGKIIVETGVTVTIKGSPWAPPQQWIELEGTGQVVFQNRFMPCVLPQWWGAKADGTTDDDDAINAAIAGAGGNIPVYCPAGNYLFLDSIAIDNQTDKLIGDGIGRTIFTRKTGASGSAILFGASATKAELYDFTLDCDNKGVDGIDTTAVSFEGIIRNVTVLDCGGDASSIALEATDLNNARIDNFTSDNTGGSPDRQILLAGSATITGLKLISAIIPTTANLEFSGDNIKIFGLYLSGALHLTKAIRVNGGNRNLAIGGKITTEDNTKTYTQLLYLESGSDFNNFKDIEIEKGATDTITNSVRDDELGNTIGFNAGFFEYIQSTSFFHVYNTTSQSIPDGSWELYEFGSADSDHRGEFPLIAPWRYTPEIWGNFRLTAHWTISLTVDQTELWIEIRKNGGGAGRFKIITSGTDPQSVAISIPVTANGTTDFFEVYVWQASGTGAKNSVGGIGANSFTGELISAMAT